MGILEREFKLLHWVPLVREITQITTFPGYRYEFFRSFKELDAYFTKELGSGWRKEAWAEFWINQHLETKNDDRREWQNKDIPVDKKIRRTGARDMVDITKLAMVYLTDNPKTSSYKLVAWLKTQGIHISQFPAWRIIKKWKANPDTLQLDDTTRRYLSSGYMSNVITPLGQSIPPGYTKEQWRKDWNEKYGLC